MLATAHAVNCRGTHNVKDAVRSPLARYLITSLSQTLPQMIRMDDARVRRLFLVVLLALPALAAAAGTARDTDLDRFMARVLARRDENWRKLQQYILDERETAELLGPGGTRLFGLARDYTWYVRDGVFVRSPVAFGGVNLSEADRRKYEDEWLAREARRHEKSGPPAPPAQASDIDSLMRLAREPQFVSAAYFLRFRFEPGRYALAGPDTYEGGAY